MIRSLRVFTGGDAMRASPEAALGAAFGCTALGCAALATAALAGADLGDTVLELAFRAGVIGAAIGPPGTGGAAARGPWESDAGLMLKKLASKSEHNKNIRGVADGRRLTPFNLAYCTPEGSCQTFPSPVKASEDA
ncbi:MAG: hypothetical protein J0I31_14595 [Rhizobiales bacterium]|nr:hypothetical protein [Hyphomicrobiales bacterium]